jgi:hypothetical protein
VFHESEYTQKIRPIEQDTIPMGDLDTVTVQDGVIDDITEEIVKEMSRDVANQKMFIVERHREEFKFCTAQQQSQDVTLLAQQIGFRLIDQRSDLSNSAHPADDLEFDPSKK